MKKLWAIVAVIAVVAGLFFFFRTKNPPAENPTTQSRTTSENAASVPKVQKPQTASSAVASPPGTMASNELASRAASPNPTLTSAAGTNETPAALPPSIALDKTRVLIHNYRDAFGQNPIGTNPEVTAALKGKNPKQINFVEDSGLRVNDKGELVDGYGTPFFFHQISGQEMEIRSAGEDRVLWTADDLVTK